MMMHFPGTCTGGSVRAIPSKSYLHRALILAAFCDAPTKIVCAQTGEDVQATVACLRALGAEIETLPDGFSVRRGAPPKDAVLSCGESGATLRFLLPVAAALGVQAEFRCEKRLRERPIEPLVAALTAHGCTVTRTETGLSCAGRLTPGTFRLPGDLSSQFLSGLLLAFPIMGNDNNIMLTNETVSKPYIDLTISVLRQFGVTVGADFSVAGNQRLSGPGELLAEGDWSNAAPFLCMGAFSDAGVSVTGLPMQSAQGDRVIVDLLRQFGAAVSVSGDTVTVRRGDLHGIHVDVRDIPDLAPFAALLGACSEGETVISGASRLRLKESDRLQSISQTLSALGADVAILPDGLRLKGSKLRGGTVDSCGDHRIVMLAAAASVAAKDSVLVEYGGAVAKSYPSFFEDYQTLIG